VVSSPVLQSLLLVCKDCKKRSSGPGKLKPKAVSSEIRRATKDQRPKPRVVLTTCLGICPKDAMAIAFAGGADGTRVAEVRTIADVQRMMPMLLSAASSA
jgi:hypothetical protein